MERAKQEARKQQALEKAYKVKKDGEGGPAGSDEDDIADEDKLAEEDEAGEVASVTITCTCFGATCALLLGCVSLSSAAQQAAPCAVLAPPRHTAAEWQAFDTLCTDL